MSANSTISFSDALRIARKAKHLTQAELASQAGLSFMTIRRYEAGETRPKLDVFVRINTILSDNSSLLYDAFLSEMVKGLKCESDNRDKEIYESIEKIATETFLKNIATSGDPVFLNKLFTIIRTLSHINMTGIEKAMDYIDILAKVPDFRADTPWI